jgi:hypothetical protein
MTWEAKVAERILHNVSLLFEQSFTTVQELNRFRKTFSGNTSANNASCL